MGIPPYSYRFNAKLFPLMLLAFTVALCPSAKAQDTDVEGTALDLSEDVPNQTPNQTTLKLGLGALVLPDFEGAKDHGLYPVPLLELNNWHRFSLSIRGLTYRLYEYKNDAESEFKKIEFRLEPALSPSVSRKEDNDFLFFTRGDSNYLRGLGDVDRGLDVGVNLFLRTGPVATRLALRQEVAGGHEGFTARLGFGTRIPFTPMTRLGIELATTWADEQYMDTFFSISHQQAYRSIYRLYNADGGFKDGSLGLQLEHDFNDRVSLVAAVQYTRLLGDAADSPLVEGPGGSDDQFTVLLGLTYKWTFGE